MSPDAPHQDVLDRKEFSTLAAEGCTGSQWFGMGQGSTRGLGRVTGVPIPLQRAVRARARGRIVCLAVQTRFAGPTRGPSGAEAAHYFRLPRGKLGHATWSRGDEHESVTSRSQILLGPLCMNEVTRQLTRT